MLTLLSEVKFLTTRDDINIKDTDFGAFKYNDKKVSTPTQQPYVDGKQDYANLRDQQYILHGRKPKQIRNLIKKLEDQLKHNRIVYCAWTDNVVMQMLLSNGLLVHICINIFTGDIIRMAFDRFFIGKLISDAITDVIITRMHILISYDVNQLTFVYLQKPNLKRNAPEKISRMDPKIFNIIISGSQTRKISRHLACNNSYDLLAVWTKSSQNEVYPWRPTVRDQDRANIHIYKLSRNKLDLLCYCWTENDPINVEFSKMNHNQLRSVEQRISRKGEVNIEICVYEVNKAKIHRTSVTSIPLQSQVCCHSFSPDNEKLMLGCIDGSVILFDEGRGITHLIKAAFIPTLVSWHADSAIVMIANDKCQIQCFDISLSCIRSQLLNEEMTPVSVLDLSHFFATQPSLLQICCSKKPDLTQYSEKYIQADSYVLLLFENGPMTILRLFGGNGLKGDVHTSGFTADVLIQQYLNLNSVEKAINVLLCLNWDSYGAMCLMSLHKIANFIFKQPLAAEREVQLQKALGSFHVPVKPLCEETEFEFGDQVRDITRKFFQYLLRYKSYEKAFNLAIDIADEDLFMDLHNCAKADRQIDLATDAYRKAEELLSRTDSRQSSHSTCSRDSCSVCETNSSADDESEKSWIGPNEKPLNNGTKAKFSKAVQHSTTATRTHKYRKNDKNSKSTTSPTSKTQSLSKARINIPKPELKVSHYSKNTRTTAATTAANTAANSCKTIIETNKNNALLSPALMKKPVSQRVMSRSASEVDFSEMQSSSHHNTNSMMLPQSSYSTDYVNQISNTDMTDPLKYQQNRIEKIPRPLPRIPYATPPPLLQPIPQHHHVVDVVPKPLNTRPSTMADWVPDQTIGIPIANPTPILNFAELQSANDNSIYSRQSVLLPPSHMQPVTSSSISSHHPKPPALIKSKSLHNIPINMPHIIHHPLISGHIPPTFHSTDNNYLIKKQVPLDAPPPLPLPPKPSTRHPSAAANTSILSTAQQNQQSKKENGEKNKVKFSDTVTVAVVPEIPRKDKSLIDRMRRANSNGFHSLVMDPRRELADSLPLCHPNDDYLKDFQPMSLRDDQQPTTSQSKEGVLTWV